MAVCSECNHDRAWHGEEGGQPPRVGQSPSCCWFGMGGQSGEPPCRCGEFKEPRVLRGSKD